jgi:hypothetical protein
MRSRYYKSNFCSELNSNGIYYVKTRYRDRNLEWSDWSDVKQFEITGSVVSNPTFTLNKTEYAQNEPITATFTGGPGNQQDWVGIYKKDRLQPLPLLRVYLY